MSNQPIKIFKADACTASIFENQYTRGNETFVIRNVSFQRSYMDKQGNWQTTNSLNASDVPKAILVLQQAYAWLLHPNNKLDYTGPNNQGGQQNNRQGNQQGGGQQGGQHMPDDDLPF